MYIYIYRDTSMYIYKHIDTRLGLCGLAPRQAAGEVQAADRRGPSALYIIIYYTVLYIYIYIYITITYI